MGLVEGLLDLDLFVSLDDVTDHYVVVAIDVQATTFTLMYPTPSSKPKDNYL